MAQNAHNNVLIIGGSQGVGLGVAKLTLTHLPNPRLIIASSNQSKLDAATAELDQIAPQAMIDTIVQDLANFQTQNADVDYILQCATAKFGGSIDHIVWTAGDTLGTQKTTGNANKDLVARMTVRMFGPLSLVHLANKYMTVSRHSSITLTSGVLIHRPRKGFMTAAGGGLESGARYMAIELAPIRVNYVVLGMIQTPLLDNFTKGNPGMIDSMKEHNLVKAIGTTEEAAEAYLYCMRCAFVTGSRIDVDGGYLLA